MLTRHLYARVVIDVDPPEERAFRARKAAGERRMRAAGIREASIAKYLSRGWPSMWVRAIRSEFARMIEDIRLPGPHFRVSQRDLDAAEARRLTGCE